MTFSQLLRASPWLLASIGLTGYVAMVAPHQVGVLAWSLSKVTIGALLGYSLDRALFPGARPGDLARTGEWPLAAHARYRRAGVVSAVILALGLGV